jgi:serine/threonine protein kinase
MKCGQCGTLMPDDASFCHTCGSQISDADGQARVSGAMTADSMQNTEKLLKKETKGEFEIEGMLGRGGMAMVYLATEVHLSRKVAIKVLPPELTFGHGVERFKREAKTAAGLDHPNIIPIYRIASGGSLFWYAMKFLEGQSLDHVLAEKGQMSLEETIEILMPVAEALDYGHLHSVIHRDIKPANIMLDLQNRVIVTDFGIAKALTESKLTASGSVIGTPFYMSPEQGMGKPVTGASDQYSVAVMTYRMLSGKIPFEGESAIEILHKHCSDTPPPLQELKPGLPDYVYQAIEKALSKKPAQRFSTVKAYVKALKEPSPEITVSDQATVMVDSDPSIADRISTEVIDRAPTPPTPSPAPARPVAVRADEKGNLGKVLVPLLAVVAVGLGGGWWWTSRETTEVPVAPTVQTLAEDTVSANTQPPTLDSVSAPEQAAEERQAETTTPLPDPPRPPPPTTGTITVTNMMPSGLVLVDGEVKSGQTFEVSPGEHRIEMRQPGYNSISETVTIRAGQTIQLPFVGRPIQTQQTTQRPAQQRPAAPQYGVLSILLRPSPGGNVFIDGLLVSATTTRVQETFDAGRHTVRIERDGYVTVDTTVTITANDTTRLRLRLRKTGG